MNDDRIELRTVFVPPQGQVVEKLKAFREELGDDLLVLQMVAPVAVVLSDVCSALSLTQEERLEVLGQTVANVVEDWEETLRQMAPDTVGGWATAWCWRSAMKKETAKAASQTGHCGFVWP